MDKDITLIMIPGPYQSHGEINNAKASDFYEKNKTLILFPEPYKSHGDINNEKASDFYKKDDSQKV